MRANIERWLLIGLFLLFATRQAFRMPGQENTALVLSIVKLLVSGFLIVLLLRACASAALTIAILAGLAVLGLAALYVVMPMPDVPRPSWPFFAVRFGTALILGLCALDLWRQWRKKPNQQP